MNHYNYFGFKENPFRMTPDRDFFYPSVNHQGIETVIRFGIEEGEGIIIVTGEVGTGKTMVLRHLTAKLPPQFETALILSPDLTPKELILAILKDIGLQEKIDSQSGLDSLLPILNDHLFLLAKAGKRLIVIIDEAQNLSIECLEQLRLLSNFESDKQKWLQIILVGQPELKFKVERSCLRQLLQRVTIFETLQSLSRQEMVKYVNFRLRIAGRSDMRLGSSAAWTLWAFTKGVPRLINKIMNRTLLTACANQEQKLSAKYVYKAATSFRALPTLYQLWLPRRVLVPLSIVIFAAILVIAGSVGPFSSFLKPFSLLITHNITLLTL